MKYLAALAAALLAMLADAAGTSSPPAADLPPRALYNQGLELLRQGDAAAAADAFLAARDSAGPDPELRYRAAFNLGAALAAGIDAAAPPEERIAALRASAAWFGDAVRLAPPDDNDARINLELISRRVLALADALNDGNRLEARLDRLIDDQRALRDGIRALLSAVAAEGAATEPLGFQRDFDALASRERELLAVAGEGLDLAAGERLFLEQTPAGERTPEQGSRIAQLRSATDYLERARQSLADARRRLRRLEGERAHRRADAALAELKRAREQLADPVAVLRAVLRDEVELVGHTRAFAVFAEGLQLGEAAPPWLTQAHLAERQLDAAARAGGVLTRFDALAAAGARAEDAAEQRVLEAAGNAAEALDEGLAAMREAVARLRAGAAREGLAAEERAVAALGRAIEAFADARGLVDLAHAGQRRIVALLAGEDAADAEALPLDARLAAVDAVAGDNARRLERLRGALAQEFAAPDAPDAADAAGGAAGDAAAAAQARAERHAEAEELRGRTARAVAAVRAALDALRAGAGDAEPARAAAGEGMAALDALRLLLFTLVEHLHALHGEQTETRDLAATAQFESAAGRADAAAAGIGRAAERQGGHAALADALAQALAQQADAAPDAGAAQQAARLAQAATAVRQAGARMHGAEAELAAAVDHPPGVPLELEPALAEQMAAIEHLETALELLSPPGEGETAPQRDSGAGAAQQSGAQDAQAREGEQQVSQRQAIRRLQAIRDREAERQRQRLRQSAPREPVEKDW